MLCCLAFLSSEALPNGVIPLQVPHNFFAYKGRKPTHQRALVLEYMETIPRHYSHYSMSSLHEYIDCASSILNWYRGPTDINEDGSVSPCFLEWLDEKMGTTNYELYKTYHFYPGVNATRDYVHPALTVADALLPPKPCVSYNYFLSVVTQYALRFKDMTPDQCARCNQFRAEVKNATATDRDAILQALNKHKLEADKGYANRAAGIAYSKAAWENVVLPPPSDFTTLGVTPLPPVPFQSRPEASDFTQCDMGGGCRTPLIRAGPQYFLRTLPAKPYYICSEARGDHAFWWNETISNFGANSICSSTTPCVPQVLVLEHYGLMVLHPNAGTGQCGHIV